MSTLSNTNTKIADQVWIALALLTRESANHTGFSASAIKERIRKEFGSVSPGAATHIAQHSLATKPASPSRNRMITKHGSLNYLYREGDPYHPDRKDGKVLPKPQEIPSEYHDLLAWYGSSYANELKVFSRNAALLAYTPTEGSGLRDIAERHDEYLAHSPRMAQSGGSGGFGPVYHQPLQEIIEHASQ